MNYQRMENYNALRYTFWTVFPLMTSTSNSEFRFLGLLQISQHYSQPTGIGSICFRPDDDVLQVNQGTFNALVPRYALVRFLEGLLGKDFQQHILVKSQTCSS